MKEDTPRPIPDEPSDPRRQASLFLDDQEISIGHVNYEEGGRTGNFYPVTLPLATIPSQGVHLRVSGKARGIPLEEIVPCRANQLDHWDFRLNEQG